MPNNTLTVLALALVALLGTMPLETDGTRELARGAWDLSENQFGLNELPHNPRMIMGETAAVDSEGLVAIERRDVHDDSTEADSSIVDNAETGDDDDEDEDGDDDDDDDDDFDDEADGSPEGRSRWGRPPRRNCRRCRRRCRDRCDFRWRRDVSKKGWDNGKDDNKGFGWSGGFWGFRRCVRKCIRRKCFRCSRF